MPTASAVVIADCHPIDLDPEEVDRSEPKPTNLARPNALQLRKQRLRHCLLVEVAQTAEEFSQAMPHFIARTYTGAVSPYLATFNGNFVCEIVPHPARDGNKNVASGC